MVTLSSERGPAPKQPDPTAHLWAPARQPAVPFSFSKPSPSVPHGSAFTFCF